MRVNYPARLVLLTFTVVVLTACGSAATPTPAPATATPALVAATATTGPTTLPTVVAPPATPTLLPLTLTSPPTQIPPSPTVLLQPSPTATPQAQAQAPVPICSTPTKTTPAQTEGPYYKANTPERASLLEPAMAGTKLIISGYVLTSDCTPVAGAWLDFWQADSQGVYDNAGYTLRGHQFTDEQGRYQLETVIPGEYPGRTSHIHVKVQAPGGPVLTSQLYMPGEPDNDSDSIFDPALVMAVQKSADGMLATFNFVLASW